MCMYRFYETVNNRLTYYYLNCFYFSYLYPNTFLCYAFHSLYHLTLLVPLSPCVIFLPLFLFYLPFLETFPTATAPSYYSDLYRFFINYIIISYTIYYILYNPHEELTSEYSSLITRNERICMSCLSF